jgi:hypothetical protein
MAHDDSAPPVGPQEVEQPLAGVVVEVVGGLVQQEQVAAGEQDAGQLDPAALPAGQGPDVAVDPVGPQAQAGSSVRASDSAA